MAIFNLSVLQRASHRALELKSNNPLIAGNFSLIGRSIADWVKALGEEELDDARSIQAYVDGSMHVEDGGLSARDLYSGAELVIFDNGTRMTPLRELRANSDVNEFFKNYFLKFNAAACETTGTKNDLCGELKISPPGM